MFNAQLENTSEGDFVQLVKRDFEEINIPFDLIAITNTGVKAFKSTIKNKIKEAALKYLHKKQQTHSKVKDIKYDKLETQSYLTSPLFTNIVVCTENKDDQNI